MTTLTEAVFELAHSALLPRLADRAGPQLSIQTNWSRLQASYYDGLAKSQLEGFTMEQSETGRTWTVEEAKARLSDILRLAEEEGPQRIGERRPFIHCFCRNLEC